MFFFILNSRLQENNVASIPNTFHIKHHKTADDFMAALPFSLTNDQLSVLNDIRADITGEYISQRLIQGDVGSGKTIVAIIALYINYL